MPDEHWHYLGTANQYVSPLLRQWACKKCGLTYTAHEQPRYCQHCYLEAQVKVLGEATLG